MNIVLVVSAVKRDTSSRNNVDISVYKSILVYRTKKKKFNVMEFKRDSVIDFYFAGQAQVPIDKALQHLKVNKSCCLYLC